MINEFEYNPESIEENSNNIINLKETKMDSNISVPIVNNNKVNNGIILKKVNTFMKNPINIYNKYNYNNIEDDDDSLFNKTNNNNKENNSINNSENKNISKDNNINSNNNNTNSTNSDYNYYNDIDPNLKLSLTYSSNTSIFSIQNHSINKNILKTQTNNNENLKFSFNNNINNNIIIDNNIINDNIININNININNNNVKNAEINDNKIELKKFDDMNIIEFDKKNKLVNFLDDQTKKKYKIYTKKEIKLKYVLEDLSNQFPEINYKNKKLLVNGNEMNPEFTIAICNLNNNNEIIIK